MNFYDLRDKTSLSNNETVFMVTYKEVNGKYISFKSPISIMQKFYLNTELLDRMIASMENFRTTIAGIVSQVEEKDAVDNQYLLKRDSNYERSKLLTESKLNSLLEQYCTKEKIDIDIENCKEHSRSIATSLANSLATNALIAKTENMRANRADTNTEDIVDAIGEIPAPAGSGTEG